MRALVRLLAAATLARSADAAAAVVIVLASVERYGGPAQGALALAALMVPHVVAGPFAGILTDRAARPRLVHAGFVAVFGLCLGSVPLLLGHVPLVVVLGPALVAGCCGPMILGGLSSRVDDVTPPARQAQARGLDAATYNIAEIAGPATGATITAALGASAAAGVLAAACLCAAAVLLTVDAVPHAGHAGGGRVIDDLRAGLRCVVASRPLRSVTAATCVASFGVGALTPTAVLLGIHARHPAGGGLLVTVFGAGALVGSLLVARFPVRRLAPHLVAIGCLIGLGAALGVVAFAPSTWPSTIGLFTVAGFFDGPLLASVLRVRAAEAPARLRTQVFALGTGLKMSAAALGSASFTLVAGLGAGLVVGLVAGAQLVAALVGAALLSGRRGPSTMERLEPAG